MIRLLYNVLWPVGLALFLPGYLLKMFRRGAYRRNFGQRLGFYTREVRGRLRAKRPLWIHAVSVGEVLIALRLARELQTRSPELPLVLTTTTTTGYALAEKTAPAPVTVLYSPLDFWPVMRRAFATIAPSKIVLIEAEVWPNMLHEADRRDVPVVLANARLSHRSEKRFLRFRFALAPMFRKLSLVCVTDAVDTARSQKIGARAECIHVTGNIKFDAEQAPAFSAEPRQVLNEIGITSARPILLGGSTHRGEEQILAGAFLELRREFADLFLVIAPRHVERAAEIESLLRGRDLRVCRRSAPRQTASDVLLIDSTGELANWYNVATVVFIGKSMAAHGGQNPVEAIAAGKPVMFGPHMENFAAIARALIESDGATCVRNRAEFVGQAARLLRDARERETMVSRAREVLAPHRGATVRTAELIRALS
ncbi:MAG: 3-deoxy-D-manno-octulosonic acid transferase [Verrucomicrobia bacterium]|nr:3-deoxy-D-manno-octulosonic acid transferase [Verrucomicrobiota bacterium]